MRFKDVVLEGIQLDDDNSGNFYVPCTDDLIETMNDIRESRGNKDLVGVNYENDVWYNFFLIFVPAEKEIRLVGTANGSEKDDWISYDIGISSDEKELLMFKIIEALANEL